MIRKIGSKAFALMKIYINPANSKILFRDLFRLDSKVYSNEDCLQAAMEWLCRAQDITGCGGVSGVYFFDKGWSQPYPETTGYIIPTFLQYAALTNNDSYIERAVMMGDWEIAVQLPSGAVRGGMGVNDYPIVFNTGQVILGWTALYRETKLNRFLDAATKAADWLVTIQDSDGKWSKYTYMDIPHVYHTRVAWSLLQVYSSTHNEKYKIAAEKQVFWALTHAKENRWFNQMGFTLEETPLTHTIAYTLRGLIESSFYLVEETKQKILKIVQKASENIMKAYELRKRDPYSMPMYLPATLDERCKSKDNYSCLTGDAQISIIWLKLYNINNDAWFLNSALKLIDQVKATQSLSSKHPGIRGGIAGSYPLWGGYMHLAYPNWSTKFFADAIILQESAMRKLEQKEE